MCLVLTATVLELGEAFALGIAICNAALAAVFLERMDVAQRLLQESAEHHRRERLEWWSPEPAICLACVAAYAGEAERAATFIGFGEAVPAVVPVAPGDQRVHDTLVARFIAPARAALGDEARQRAAATGAAMTPDELYEFVLD